METSETQSTSPFDELVVGAGLMAGAANVIMQLSRPGVGYGVLESTVDSGNLFRHPAKRTRTTFTYLAVAILGTDEEKKRYRAAVNRAHAFVHSTESSPVQYNAFDPQLQLWVAACLYKGFEDSYETLIGPIPADKLEAVYSAGASLGTTLQVRPEMWPASRAEFQEYWDEALNQVSIDDAVRAHLHDIAALKFLPRVVSMLFGRFHLFVTTGFLPPPFRKEMRLPWTQRDQERFDRLMRVIGAVSWRMPRQLKQLPFNYYLWDLRRRIKAGRPLV